uniref:Serine/threonine protein kinase n=1 Tax=Solibacter usitatus (strain Ellin6076) TaxID=234267 RepID=Q01Y07_SOLUE
MEPQRWQQIEQLYHLALQQETAERRAFVIDACRGDAELRREVESLLAQSGSTGALVDRTAWGAVRDLASPQTTLKAREMLGPYEIVGLLGTGGMGEVYAAVDTRLGRKVAIKVSQARFSGRFEREARAISALNHPNICTLHDVGPNYLVTELVDGETLRDWLKRATAGERYLDVARQVLQALCAAHRAGIVHRDLKPANIMVRFDGYVKVLDFGLAKWITPGGHSVQLEPPATMTLSQPGQIVGTVAYMSPEQILGQEVDQRSDLFAFGIILYEILSGLHPWPRKSAVDTMHAILHDEPASMHAIPANIARIVRRLLRKNPTDRFASAEEVLDAFAATAADREPGSIFEEDAAPLTSIAVLPFFFLSDVQDRKAYSLGFADALITTLSSVEEIAVLPTSTIANHVPGIDLSRTCEDLGVRYLLQGSVQRQGSQWRVSTQLYDSRKQKIAYAERHDFVRESVFEVQDEIGRRVLESLQMRLKQAAPKSRDRYSSDPEAFEAFMTGLRESYSDRQETLLSAADHLSQAVERDPDFALAHATLSYVAMHIHFEFDPKLAWLDPAEHHCGRALALDPALPEGHLARSFILWSPARNFQHAEAIQALEKVLAAQPNNERAHNRIANICVHIGRFEEAYAAQRRARRSNPKTRSNNLEFLYLYSGDFARAEAAAESWVREKPGSTYALWFHAIPALMNGDLDMAERRLAAGLRLYPDEPLMISLQGMLYARRGQTELALDCVRKAQETPHSFGHMHHTHYQIACVYAVLRDAGKALAWLERSVYTGCPCWPFFKVDPHLDNLRPEPRFQQLIADLERQYTALKISRL